MRLKVTQSHTFFTSVIFNQSKIVDIQTSEAVQNLHQSTLEFEKLRLVTIVTIPFSCDS